MDSVINNNKAIKINTKKEIEDDTYLVKAAIKGGEKEFMTLIEGYKSYLYKTAFLYVKNEHDALDIYQETIYKAFVNIPKLKNTSFFKTWITKILINNTNDKLRVSGKQNEVVNIDVVDNINYSDNSISIEEKIDLYEAIDSLSQKYKTPIILMYFHGMSIKEIANIMDCPGNTVKSYIHRGKKILWRHSFMVI